MEKIVIAPYQMHKNLLSKYRKEDFFNNPKILSKEDFLDKFFGRVNDEGFDYLFSKKDINFDNLINILPFISRSHDKCVRGKNKMLYDWKCELEANNGIEKDEFFEGFIKNKEFDIFGYSRNDKELINLLNLHNLKCNFIDFSISDFKLFVDNFTSLEDEIFYMLNEIASLIEQGVSTKDIFIYTKNENALFYIGKYYKSFGFPINFPDNISLYSQEIFSNFLTQSRKNCSFEAGLEVLETSDNLIDENIIARIKEISSKELSFEKKYDYLSSYLKSCYLKNARFENGVNIVSSQIYVENKHIFIPCFAQNIFPISFKDGGYISDADKEELGCLTSLELCRIEDEISRKFISSNNTFHLSKSKSSFSEKYFPSPFVKSLNLIEREVNTLSDCLYSKKYGEYRLGIDEDNKLYFLQESSCLNSLRSQLNVDYRGYSNVYKNAEAHSENDYLKVSYSSINSFYKCPFAYYLNCVLKISTFKETFYTKFGKVAHYVFEHQYEDGFNFEDAFSIGKQQFEWQVDEEVLLDCLKDKIRAASEACVLHYKSYADKPKIVTEIKLQTKLDQNTVLEGQADKIMILNDTDLVVVDYKTNSESFSKKNLEFGLSMQLPTYAILLEKSSQFSDYNLSGLYINNVIPTSFCMEQKDDEIIDSYLKLNGITVADYESVVRIDSSILNGKSFFLKGISTKNGSLKSGNSIVGKEELNEIKQLVINKYIQATRKIRNNEFDISPLVISGMDACEYCEFKDICFVKSWQKRSSDDEEGGNE